MARLLFSPWLRVALLLLVAAAPLAFAQGQPPAISPDDDLPFGLFGLFALLLVLCIIFILIGLGLAVAIVGLVSLAVLVGLGIISSSALIGFYQRRYSSGLRAFHYQACVALSLPGGLLLGWLASHLLHLGLPLAEALFLGAAAGAAAGLATAFLFDRLATLSYTRLLRPAFARLADRA